MGTVAHHRTGEKEPDAAYIINQDIVSTSLWEFPMDGCISGDKIELAVRSGEEGRGSLVGRGVGWGEGGSFGEEGLGRLWGE